jgi:aspartyl-tRNA(Asn)/glutamyl-tRNA(Gln) amidotransferase subunit B
VGAHDYRYYPESDLVTLHIASWVPGIRATLPELPDAKRERFVKQYALADDHAKSLTSEIRLANFYEAVAAPKLAKITGTASRTLDPITLSAKAQVAPRLAAVWIADVLKGELNYRDLTIDAFLPEHMVDIIQMLERAEITEDGAVEIIRSILDKNGSSPEEIVQSMGLGKAGDDAVQKAVREAVAESAAAVADYKAGSERALNFIVGLVMKKTRGKASPGEVHDLVKAEVEKL